VSKEEPVLQNIRNFTVQIRRIEDDRIVGTGIAVSEKGKIITCEHVVEAVLGVKPCDADGKEIGIYFPQIPESRRARVSTLLTEFEDDIVELELCDGLMPLGSEKIAKLGGAENSEGHKFRSYGYSPTGEHPSTWAHGIILGSVETTHIKKLQVDPVQLSSRQIDRGMSGAAVLDDELNAVVGIISARYFPKSAVKDDIGYAVDNYVLTFNPFNYTLENKVAKLPAPEPKTDQEKVRTAGKPKEAVILNNAPTSLDEWVGRAELLGQITEDCLSQKIHMTGLIGFGGEGKSSLARRWLDNMLEGMPDCPKPDGVFWWGFYDRPGVDEFFEAALEYISGGTIKASELPSSTAKAHFIAAMLSRSKYIFVLDGLEVLQEQDGDKYGLLRSRDLRDFLHFFAGPGHDSFCLVTSRAPLFDLIEYNTYSNRDVMRMSESDGRDLLRRYGVKNGTEAELDKIVREWDGHALTLSLIGTYLAEKYDGDIHKADKIEPPTADEPRYERVHRVLRRYDEHLTEAERAFMIIFSVFRTPVKEEAFPKVFRTATGKTAINAPITRLNNTEFGAMLELLKKYRILRYDARERHYTTHPLIRRHYSAILVKGGIEENKEAIEIHRQIKDYYLATAGDAPRYPTLEDLKPFIEVVHHLCKAGAYDEAFNIVWNQLFRNVEFVISRKLSAWDTVWDLMLEFFADRDTTGEPLVSEPSGKGWILNESGLCLMCLGRLAEAVSFYDRGNKIDVDILKAWRFGSTDFQNLSELHCHLGSLKEAEKAAKQALEYARRAEDEGEKRVSLTSLGWVAHLNGDIKKAGELFKKAEKLEKEIDPASQYLYSLRGIQHAEYLLKTGDI